MEREMREVTCPRCGGWHITLRRLIDERGRLNEDLTLIFCQDCNMESRRSAAQLFEGGRALTPPQAEALAALRGPEVRG